MCSTTRFLSLGLLALVLLALAPILRPKKIAYFTTGGPFCSGCVEPLEQTATAVDGGEQIGVDVRERLVRITFDETKTTPEAILKHIGEKTTSKLTLEHVTDVQAGKSSGA